MRNNHVGRAKHYNLFDWFNAALMIVLSLIFLYPLVMTLSLSFSTPSELVGVNNVLLLPKGFSLQSYQTLLEDKSILRYYANTLLYASTGTVLCILLTSLLAYPLTIRDFKGRKLIHVLLLITMFFGGGMIATYLTIRSLHMLDTIWAIIIPPSISAWNTFMFVNFFRTIPEALRESAAIDGAGHLRILFRIILPLSTALIATISLFTAVGFWNDYFRALLYLNSNDLYPIQIFLRKIMISMDITTGNADVNHDMSRLLDMVNANPRTVKAAAAIITMLPILCVYPFVQRYFTKGVMLGAVKA